MKNEYRKKPRPIEIYKMLIKKLGKEPTLEEWLEEGTFKRTTWYEARRTYAAIKEVKENG